MFQHGVDKHKFAYEALCVIKQYQMMSNVKYHFVECDKIFVEAICRIVDSTKFVDSTKCILSRLDRFCRSSTNFVELDIFDIFYIFDKISSGIKNLDILPSVPVNDGL